MKFKYFLFIIIFTSFSNLVSYSKTTILWTNYFSGQEIGNAEAHSLQRFDDKYCLFYGGYYQNGSIIGPKNGLIVASHDGEVLYRQEFIDKGIMFHRKTLSLNKTYVHLFNCRFGLVNRPYLIYTNEEGTILYSKYDTSSSRNKYSSLPILSNDSIYSPTYSFEGNNNLINIFDDSLNFIRSTKIDFSQIEVSFSAGTPRDFIFSNDSNFIFLLTGPDSSDYYREKYGILVKTTKDGNILWSKQVFHSDFDSTRTYNISQNAQGEIIIFGELSKDGSNYIYLTKFTSTGDQLWQSYIQTERLEFPRKFYILPYSKKIAICGTEYLVENIHSLSCLWLFDNNGSFIEKTSWNCGTSIRNFLEGIAELENSHLIAFGQHGSDSIYLAEIQLEGNDVKYYQSNNNTLQITASPSPFSDYSEISIDNLGAQPLEAAIYDAMGNKVRALHSGKASGALRKSFLINGNGLAPGVYFVHVNYGGKVFVEKIVRE